MLFSIMLPSNMKAFILAGGKGTRLSELTSKIPKPMIKINGKPLLQYQIELLKNNGVVDICIVINYLGNVIKKYFEDGKKFGVKISYYEEPAPLGTAGAIKRLAKGLKDDFLVLYGDILVNMNLRKLISFHKKKHSLGTLVVHPNNHPFDSDLLDLDDKNYVKKIFSKPHSPELIYKNCVNAAIYVFSPIISKYIPKNKKSDFGKEVFPYVIAHASNKLSGYSTHEYIKDIGTIDRVKEAEFDIRTNKYKNGGASYKRPAIFLDRDGVIIEQVDQISRIKDVKLISRSDKAILAINNSKYLTVIITNQPQAAKGICNEKMIFDIGKKTETLLGNKGAKVDGTYYCLHHPDKGFKGENLKYKIKCNCRKPNIGMIKNAVKDFNIDLKKSYMVGDSTTDALTARNAKIRFLGVKTGYACKDNKHNVKINKIYTDLYNAIKSII